MRLRKKPWGEYELENNKNLITSPEKNKGKWKDFFCNENPLHIEIGTGKGNFITTTSLLNKDINYLAIERQTNVIVSALKKGREKGIGGNIGFFVADVKDILNYFESGEISRIYINFCDPWERKKKWAKKRLSHTNFLKLYETLFKDRGEIFFKTDNKNLFEFSLNEFCDRGWQLKNISLDLHNSNMKNNVKTEYEEKFSNKGMPIYRLEAYYKKS